MSTNIENVDVARSLNAIHGDKAKKKLRKARQMIDKYPPFTVKWVVLDDIIDEFQAAGVTDKVEAARGAQQKWGEVCFQDLRIYQKGSKKGTQAEFMRDWLQRGYTWEASIDHLKTLSLTKAPKRALSPTFKEYTLKRLKEKAAQTYAPEAKRKALDDGRGAG